MTATDIDSEEDIAATASSLRTHMEWLASAAEKTADALERAGEELEVLRDVQWIVNRSTMDTGPGTLEETIKNARELVVIADEYLAWRETQGGTPGRPLDDQRRVAAWIKLVLGEESAANGPERALRLAEEAIELTQSLGVDREALHKLVDYVYARPPGSPAQEIAGCQVTLYGAASALGVRVDEVCARELVRISKPEVMDRVRRRQAEKRAVVQGRK